jgi:hypothetical protein
LNYYVKPNLFLTLGHAYIRTSPDGSKPFGEQRLWQQAQWMPKVRGVVTSHRFRQEQRWLPNLSVQDRFRYFFRTEIPVRGKTLFWSLQNEVFVKGGRSANRRFYDQNRAYTAFGRRFSAEKGSWGRVEAGYMYQHLLRRDGRFQENNHIFVVSFLSSFSVK